jgi:hypothetical protein
MRKCISWIFSFFCAGFLALLAGACLHRQAMARAAIFNARAFLQDAYGSYQRTGTLPQPDGNAHVRAVTTMVAVGATNYQAVLALDWPYFSGEGTLAVTSNQVFLWLDNKRGAKVIDKRYRPPLFSRGL